MCVGTWLNRQQSHICTRLPCFQLLLLTTSGNKISGGKPFLVVEVGLTPILQDRWACVTGLANQRSLHLWLKGCACHQSQVGQSPTQTFFAKTLRKDDLFWLLSYYQHVLKVTNGYTAHQVERVCLTDEEIESDDIF